MFEPFKSSIDFSLPLTLLADPDIGSAVRVLLQAMTQHAERQQQMIEERNARFEAEVGASMDGGLLGGGAFGGKRRS